MINKMIKKYTLPILSLGLILNFQFVLPIQLNQPSKIVARIFAVSTTTGFIGGMATGWSSQKIINWPDKNLVRQEADMLLKGKFLIASSVLPLGIFAPNSGAFICAAIPGCILGHTIGSVMDKKENNLEKILSIFKK